MYPTLHSDLDYTKKSDDILGSKGQIQKMGQSEKNCKHSSTKLTRDFFTKVNIAKLSKTETYVFKNDWILARILTVMALMILFFTSFYGIIFMWCTNGFNNILYSNLIINEGSTNFEIWKNPTVKPITKIYLFNYTNIERYEDGIDKKLNIEEKGPYVYEETVERVNATFNGDLVSYQLKRSYRFIPELSKGRQNDIVVVPNILMLSAAAMHRYSNFFTRLTISSGLNGFYAKAFHSLAADRFIMGYDDDLYSLSKKMLKFQNKQPSEKLGLLSKKVGFSPITYTMHTGLNDINQLGSLKSINGKDQLDMWSTKDCDRVQGTDGTMFSPKTVNRKQPIKIFMPDTCRHFDLEYKQDNKIFNGDIPSYKYVASEYLFDSPENHPNNQCYCEMEGGTCPMQGLFNTSLCSMGAPTFVSYPHFYRADSRLLESFTGLNPNKTQHETYLDLHPTLGFPMNARTRMQINIQVLKTFGFSQLDKLDNELILPMAWVDMAVEDESLPQDIKDLIYTATYTVAIVKNLLKYGSIIIALITIIPILANIKYTISNNKRTSSTKSLQKQETDC
ncbi:hypothetical protein WA026_002735 [Henosepilachna vigintioctopunctata]|uniref:Scavenger receptor class B member 1 n=1 Tax=Henosepilachna vigintioctopunctata TaxID=420089 RepID=A0AAW1TVS3_9CUCU